LAESGEVAKRRLIWSAFALLFYGALLVLVYAHHNWVADSIRRRWAGGGVGYGYRAAEPFAAHISNFIRCLCRTAIDRVHVHGQIAAGLRRSFDDYRRLDIDFVRIGERNAKFQHPPPSERRRHFRQPLVVTCANRLNGLRHKARWRVCESHGDSLCCQRQFIGGLKLYRDFNRSDSSRQDGNICHRFRGMKMRKKAVVAIFGVDWQR
jgi:hypothetical protein